MLALLTLAGLLLFSLKNSDISTRANGSHLAAAAVDAADGVLERDGG